MNMLTYVFFSVYIFLYILFLFHKQFSIIFCVISIDNKFFNLLASNVLISKDVVSFRCLSKLNQKAFVSNKRSSPSDNWEGKSF